MFFLEVKRIVDLRRQIPYRSFDQVGRNLILGDDSILQNQTQIVFRCGVVFVGSSLEPVSQRLGNVVSVFELVYQFRRIV